MKKILLIAGLLFLSLAMVSAGTVEQGKASIRASEKAGYYWDGTDQGYKTLTFTLSLFTKDKPYKSTGTLTMVTEDKQRIVIELDPKTNPKFNSMVDVRTFTADEIEVTQGAWITTTKKVANKNVRTKEYRIVQYTIYPNEHHGELVIVGTQPILIDFGNVKSYKCDVSHCWAI